MAYRVNQELIIYLMSPISQDVLVDIRDQVRYQQMPDHFL